MLTLIKWDNSQPLSFPLEKTCGNDKYLHQLRKYKYDIKILNQDNLLIHQVKSIADIIDKDITNKTSLQIILQRCDILKTLIKLCASPANHQAKKEFIKLTEEIHTAHQSLSRQLTGALLFFIGIFLSTAAIGTIFFIPIFPTAVAFLFAGLILGALSIGTGLTLLNTHGKDKLLTQQTQRFFSVLNAKKNHHDNIVITLSYFRSKNTQ